MAEITVAHPRTRDTDETRAALRARAARGLELYKARGSEIVRTAPFCYRVPGSRSRSYAVNYRRETCDCLNFEHAGLGACKHLFSVGALRASRRTAAAAGL